MRVILIEPDPVWKAQILQWLQEAGIQCYAAGTASSAFREIKTEPCLGMIAQENLLTFGLSPSTLQQAPLLILCDGDLPSYVPQGVEALHHPKCGDMGFKAQLLTVIQGWRLRAEHHAQEQAQNTVAASNSEDSTQSLSSLATPNPITATQTNQTSSEPEVLLVGSSTGGPEALYELLSQIKILKQPMLIVQHQPENLADTLASQLQEACTFPVLVAHHQQRAEDGCIYLAPGGKHLILRRATNGSLWLELVDSPPVNYCKPSVDILFGSASIVCENRIRAIVMTGMGQDGLVGARQIQIAGGKVGTQTEASCVVYGMPKAIDDAKISVFHGNPKDLARWISTGL